MKNIIYFTTFFAFLFLLTSCHKEELQDVSSVNMEDYLSAEDGLITLESGMVVEKRNGNFIWEGDIQLSEIQLENLNKYGDIISEKPDYVGHVEDVHPVYNVPFESSSGERRVARAFSINPTPYNMWAMVRIRYGTNLSTAEKQKIHSALLEMQSETNVRFYNATCEPLVDPEHNFEYPNIELRKVSGDVSQSFLGRQGGIQYIDLTANAFSQTFNRTIIHEIGHALGLRHEHTRTDRDSYVSIKTANLTPQGQSQFIIPSTNYYQVGAYSFESIMGYSSYTGSTSLVHDTSKPMYTKLDGSDINVAWWLSSSDKSWINNFYIPYIARSDTYAELDNIVYKPDNTVMTSAERLNLQAALNNGNPTPPNCCSIDNDLGKFTCP